ncbi:MAG: sodium-dependent transporter, partial [Lachnospiraceae bacterium]|nr:sodium-dependent transporter [Lachnospiraceae bacterium]
FFLMVIFAALTSCISIMEAIVSSFIDRFHLTRKKATVIVTAISFVMAVIVCLGYNLLFFRFELPNGSEAQILDIMDYISNNVMMPIVSIATCILIGWIVKPRYVIDEVNKTKTKFGRKYLYIAMVTVIAPLLLVILLLQALGVV